MTTTRRLLAFATLTLAAGPLWAADNYPSKPIRLVVPFAAGGTVDIVARILSNKMALELGQPVIVDNRGGAGGVIGADAVAKAPADGYTLLLHNVSMVYAPGLYKTLPFDVIKDFKPVTLVGETPSVMVINPALPYPDVAAFTAQAKSKPGSLNYGSAGNGTSSHLAAELYRRVAKVEVQHVPYRGGGPAVAAVLGGEVQFMIETLPSVMPNIAGGKLKPLAVTSEKRSPSLPAVPTMKEAGLNNYVYNTWFGLWAPAQTPPEVVTHLNKAMAKILAESEVRAALERSGVEAGSSTPAKFGDLVASDLKRWTEVIREAGIQPQ